MDLSNPLRSLLGDNDANVLRILARTSKPLSGRRVHELSGNASLRGSQLALSRLGHTGIVTSDATSSATFFVMNRDHLLWPTIEQALALREELFRRIQTLAAGRDITIALFGSVARMESTLSSDIDLLVIMGPKAAETEKLIDDLHDLVPTWTGNDVQVYDISERELRDKAQMRDPIVDSWRTEAQLLYGTKIEDRLRVTV